MWNKCNRVCYIIVNVCALCRGCLSVCRFVPLKIAASRTHIKDMTQREKNETSRIDYAAFFSVSAESATVIKCQCMLRMQLRIEITCTIIRLVCFFLHWPWTYGIGRWTNAHAPMPHIAYPYPCGVMRNWVINHISLAQWIYAQRRVFFPPNTNKWE